MLLFNSVFLPAGETGGPHGDLDGGHRDGGHGDGGHGDGGHRDGGDGERERETQPKLLEEETARLQESFPQA